MTQFQEVKISDIFDILGENSKLTKTFIENNKGIFPVYSGDTKSGCAYGYVDFYKYDSKILVWTTYGDAGNLKIVEGKLNIGRNASGLHLKDEFSGQIYLEYVKYLCEIYFKLNAQGGKGELRKLPQQRVKDIIITLPTKENGEFGLEKQKEIAEKYQKLEKIKDRIRVVKEDIEEKIISLENQYTGVEKNLHELFTPRQGNAFYTKKRILENNWVGDTPVYSSNTKENGLLIGIQKEHINKKDIYYQYCLTWSIDGYAGKIFVRNEQNKDNLKEEKYYFTINNHCGILIPKLEGLHLPFIKIILQPKFFTRAKGYGNNKLGNNQIEDIYLKIPTNENGEFDLEKQKEIAEKYQKLEKIRNNLVEELEYLEKVKVEI